MANLNKNYRCKICNGDLAFDPVSQTWKCKYCDSIFTLEDMEEQGKTELHEEDYEKGKKAEEFGYTSSTDDTGTKAEDLKVYQCKYCGAKIITDKNTAATHCVYCGNPVVIEEQLVQGFTPKFLIPFQHTQKEAKEQYITYIKKPFTPKSFLSEEHIDKIKGVYLPFWLYDAKTSGYVKAECENTRVYVSGEQEVTEHDRYQVYRAGEAVFEHIPADASSRTDNETMDSIEPFDFTKIQKFEMPYLAGFYAEKYDEDDQVCYPRIKTRIENSIREKLLEKAGSGYGHTRVTGEQLDVDSCQAQYALLPVWLLYGHYSGKDYMFAMNGQTGKMVGDVPVDKKKAAGCFLTWFGIATGVSFLCSMLLSLF